MTPDEAAEQAAHVLKQATAWADKPETVSGFVQVADAWTRLHTALKAGQRVTVNIGNATISEDPGQAEPDDKQTWPAPALTLPFNSDQPPIVRVAHVDHEVIGWDFDTSREDLGAAFVRFKLRRI